MLVMVLVPVIRFIQLSRIPSSADISHTHRGTLCVFNSTHTERLYVYSTQQTKSDSMYIQLNYIHRVRVCFKDKDISSLCLSEIDIVRVFVCDR